MISLGCDLCQLGFLKFTNVLARGCSEIIQGLPGAGQRVKEGKKASGLPQPIGHEGCLGLACPAARAAETSTLSWRSLCQFQDLGRLGPMNS